MTANVCQMNLIINQFILTLRSFYESFKLFDRIFQKHIMKVSEKIITRNKFER